MPDENSNLNLPAAARRPSARRRGRRGGRGRPRAPQSAPENSATPEESLTAGAPVSDLNEAGAAEENFPAETEGKLPETPVAAEKNSRPPPERNRPDRRPEPLRPKVFVKPADYRPAETSAISEAVAHANQIAESMRQMNERLEEILELVELAERQKIADERELDELRRALRRIQPPREPRREEPRGNRREQPPRGEEPRRPRDFREPRENARPPEESPTSTAPDEPAENRDADE